MNIFDPLNIALILILVYSAILHEIAHGYIAERLGDPTARLMGRITLDIRKHIDPYMTIILPFIMIISHFPVILGGAKPVPVDPFNLRDGRKDLALVSLAGPATNLLIGIVMSILLHVFFPRGILSTNVVQGVIAALLLITAKINITLAIFNMLPIPPLDGSKVFSLILPDRLAHQYLALGSYGPFLLLFFMLVPLGGFSIFNIIGTLSCSLLTLLQLPC